MSQPTIGFIGLGIMGRPMTGHLLKAGYSLVAHDLNCDAVTAAVAAGAAEAHSPQEVAARSDVIIISVNLSQDSTLVTPPH